MTPEGRRIWNSPEGVNLLHKILRKQPLTEQDQKTVSQLKQSGPPNAPKSQSPSDQQLNLDL
jgi:hypothetical protein